MKIKTIIIIGIVLLVLTNGITWLSAESIIVRDANEYRADVWDELSATIFEKVEAYWKDKAEKCHLIGYSWNNSEGESMSTNFVSLDCLDTFEINKSKIDGWGK